ncbi:MAG: nucleotidyltransferase domain-containing protein [Nanoarchaeota archaeon]
MDNNLTIWSVLEPLVYITDFKHLAEISRELKSPHATVRKYLNELEKQGILAKSIKGRLTLYKLNYSNLLIIDYLSLFEKSKLVARCQNDLLMKEIVSFLHKTFMDNELIIFGSAVENTKKANDIDILIIGNIKAKDKLKDFEKKFEIKFHVISVPKLDDISNTLKEEIKKKHLIINNTEIILRWILKN